MCVSPPFFSITASDTLAAEHGREKTPMRYVITLEQMVENDYPIPSYIADVFEKSAGWVETPKPVDDAGKYPRILSMDCEMVRLLCG